MEQDLLVSQIAERDDRATPARKFDVGKSNNLPFL
jgi:hypothetical protein